MQRYELKRFLISFLHERKLYTIILYLLYIVIEFIVLYFLIEELINEVRYKIISSTNILSHCILFTVSHTTDDLVFQWLPVDKVPLAVDEGIQLPQLELINNRTGDCTSVYSTGIL